MSATLTARSAAHRTAEGYHARILTAACPSMSDPIPGTPGPAYTGTATATPAASSDVVLMAINPARGDHLAGPQSVKTSPNNYYVVVITTDEKTARELESLSGGESGCHLGRMRQAQLIEAVQEARTAGSLAAQKFAGKLVKFFQPVSQPVPEDDGLSSRERQVMEFLAQGHPYKSIARDLGVSLHTVRNYLRRIYRKLGAHSRTHAVARFLCPAGRTLEA